MSGWGFGDDEGALHPDDQPKLPSDFSLRESGNWKNALWADALRDQAAGRASFDPLHGGHKPNEDQLYTFEKVEEHFDPIDLESFDDDTEEAPPLELEGGGAEKAVRRGAQVHFDFVVRSLCPKPIKATVQVYADQADLPAGAKPLSFSWTSKEMTLRPGEGTTVRLLVKADAATPARRYPYGIEVTGEGDGLPTGPYSQSSQFTVDVR